jgi:hypothetical protein
VADDRQTSDRDEPRCGGSFGHCDAEATEHCSHCDHGFCFEHSKVIAGFVFCDECIVGGWAEDLQRPLPLGGRKQ